MRTLLAAWARLSVERACIIFFVNLLVALGFGAGGALAMIDDMEIDGGTDKFGIQGSKIAARQQAIHNRDTQIWEYDRRQLSFRNATSSSSRRRLQWRELELQLYYETEDGSNLFTAEYMAQISAAESQLFLDFASRFGQGDGGGGGGGGGGGTQQGCGLSHNAGACREGGRWDDDCCAGQYYGECAAGFVFSRGDVCYEGDDWRAYHSCCEPQPAGEGCNAWGRSHAGMACCNWPNAGYEPGDQGLCAAGETCHGSDGGRVCMKPCESHASCPAHQYCFSASKRGTEPFGSFCYPLEHCSYLNDAVDDECPSADRAPAPSVPPQPQLPPAPPAPPPRPPPPPVAAAGSVGAAVEASASRPRSLAQLFFARTPNEWHFSGVPLDGVDAAARMAHMAEHVAETALLSEEDGAKRRYCASEGLDSTCVDSLQEHVASDFSACALESPVGASRYTLVGADAGTSELVAWLHAEARSLNAEQLRGVRLAWAAQYDWEELADADSDAVVLKDSTIVGVALAFVLLLLGTQLRLAFTAVFGWLQILLCFPVALFVYAHILGVKWLGVLNFITLFVVFGIGADDVFVFDAVWRQSALRRPSSDLVARMAYTLPHAASTMFATSLTTSVAFFAAAVSKNPPIRLFGIFAGLMIVVLYLMVVLWLPSVVALQARFFASCEPAKVREALASRGGAQQLRDLARDSGSGAAGCYSSTNVAAVAGGGGRSDASPPAHGDAPGGEGTRSALSAFFEDRWAAWLWRASPALVPLLLGFFCTCAVFAFNIQPASENPSLFPAAHNHPTAVRIEKALGSGTQSYPLPIVLYWGLTPRDDRGLDPSQDEYDRPSHWDARFDWSSAAAQQHLLDACDALLSEVDRVRNFPALVCPMYSWRDYLTAQNEPFPASAAAVRQHADAWAYGEDNEHAWDSVRGRGGGQLAWLRITAYSTASSSMKPAELIVHWEWWENRTKHLNDAAPPGVRHAFMADEFEAFVEMDTLYNLLDSGITSTILSCALALVVLLAFTGDALVGLLAFGCVLLIVFGVLGTSVMAGEPMGIIESVCLAILVGMSVDYAVHIGVAYVAAPAALGRRLRVSRALGAVGGAIVYGALTTTVTAAFLFIPTMVFFGVFGRFLLVICAFSALMSLVFFPALLMRVGPEDGRFELSRVLAAGRGRRANARPAGAHDAVATDEKGGEARPAEPPCATRAALLLVLLLLLAAAAAATAVTLGGDGGESDAATCSAPAQLNLTITPYTVPHSRTDSYVCQGMDLPADCAYHVTRFEPIVRSGMTHHMILYGVIEKLKPDCTVTCFDMPGQVTIMWAWAVGGGVFELPPNVGLRVGRGSSLELSTLQMHYNNAELAPGEVDESGVRLTLSTEMRQHDMATLISGMPTNSIVRIPPKQRAFAVQVESTFRLSGAVKAFSYALHGHKTATKIWAWQLRAGEVVASFGAADPYSFELQEFVMLGAELHIEPGDKLRLRCEYDTRDRDGCTYGGDGSLDEMCLHLAAVYPATGVSNFVSIESHFVEALSDPVAAWAAIYDDAAYWPPWVRDEANSTAAATCEPSAEAGFTCAAALMPGLTLHWALTAAADALDGLLRLEGQPAAAWLAVGVSPCDAGCMEGSWAVLGEPAPAGGGGPAARAVHLEGKALSMISDDASSGVLRSAAVSHADGVTELRFSAKLGTGKTHFKGGGLPTTIIGAHGDGGALAYHGSQRAHATLHLDATAGGAVAAAEPTWRATGESGYNPCNYDGENFYFQDGNDDAGSGDVLLIEALAG